MTHTDWGSAAIIVAIVAAVISLLSAGAATWAAWVSHRMLKRQTQSDKPTLEFRLHRIEGGWIQLRICLDNPTKSSWVGRRLRVLRPRDCIAANWDQTHSSDGVGSFKFDPAKMAALTTREAVLNVEVWPAGSTAPSYSNQSRGDRSWGTAYIRPPNGTRKLKMELLVESLDGIHRRERYLILRDVPQPAE